MTEILNRDFFTQTSVFIPIYRDKNGIDNFIFEVRAGQIRQGNEICFPGGLFESEVDIDFKETAIRETSEELGIDRKRIRVKKHLGCVVAPLGAIVEVFIGYIDITDISELEYNRTEVSRIFYLPVSFFKENNPEEYEMLSCMQPYVIDSNGCKKQIFPAEELGLPQKYWNRWEGRKYKLYVYKTEYGTIWGLTALLALLASKTQLS